MRLSVDPPWRHGEKGRYFPAPFWKSYRLEWGGYTIGIPIKQPSIMESNKVFFSLLMLFSCDVKHPKSPSKTWKCIWNRRNSSLKYHTSQGYGTWMILGRFDLRGCDIPWIFLVKMILPRSCACNAVEGGVCPKSRVYPKSLHIRELKRATP